MVSALSTNQGLQAQYGDRVAADLLQNSEQMAGLRTQLESLERDRKMLLTMQSAVASTETQPQSSPSDVPSAGDDSEEGSSKVVRAVSKVPRSRSSVAGGRPRAASSRVRKPGGKASKNGARPAKVTDLVEQCLVQNGEPQSAAEVATSISTKERPVSVISVRTALEGLVRRSAAYRSKQGRAVYYQHVNSTAAVTQDA